MVDIGKDLQEAYDAGYRQRNAEIVRCKDCHFFGEPTYIKGYHACAFYKTHIQGNDYCSKGIRFIKIKHDDADK